MLANRMRRRKGGLRAAERVGGSIGGGILAGGAKVDGSVCVSWLA